MSLVVCVHGIAQQSRGEDQLAAEWEPALRDGLRRAGNPGRALDLLGPGAVRHAFYGDLFRAPGRPLGRDDEPWLTPDDATPEDAELLAAWWREAAAVDPAVPDPQARTLARTPHSVQAALFALSRSRFFAGLADRALLHAAAQVRRYFTDGVLRAAARRRVEAAVDADTRLIVAHSLGSVVAYEAICANSAWPVRSLVTLGSPLGIRNLIFDRLVPAPEPFPSAGAPPGHWPPPVRWWTNITDAGDVIALVKDLRPLFGPRVRNLLVHNDVQAHKIGPYLAAAQTGTAIAAGLLDREPTGPAAGPAAGTAVGPA